MPRSLRPPFRLSLYCSSYKRKPADDLSQRGHGSGSRPSDSPATVSSSDIIPDALPPRDVPLSGTPATNGSTVLQDPALVSLSSTVQDTEQTPYYTSGNLVWRAQRSSRVNRTRPILLLCGGPNTRESSLFHLLIKAGFECVNYDILNGSQFDLVDDAVWEPLLSSIAAGEYAACFACPMCATFSQLLNLPGPSPLRDATGPGRYGRKDIKPAQQEKVRKHTVVAVRVAAALQSFHSQVLPWVF